MPDRDQAVRHRPPTVHSVHHRISSSPPTAPHPHSCIPSSPLHPPVVPALPRDLYIPPPSPHHFYDPLSPLRSPVTSALPHHLCIPPPLLRPLVVPAPPTSFLRPHVIPAEAGIQRTITTQSIIRPAGTARSALRHTQHGMAPAPAPSGDAQLIPPGRAFKKFDLLFGLTTETKIFYGGISSQESKEGKEYGRRRSKTGEHVSKTNRPIPKSRRPSRRGTASGRRSPASGKRSSASGKRSAGKNPSSGHRYGAS